MTLPTFLAHLTAPRTLAPIAVTFKDAARLSGLSESHLRFLAREKKLETSKVGRKRLS